METLTATEIRVLGALIEKQFTTPEYYPLTLNALINACNQTTNREPVVSYGEMTVARALESLREKQMIWAVSGSGSRVTKYEQRLTERLNLAMQEIAALCVLMLRGPQTAGEIRGRSGRIYEFAELAEVEATLQAMAEASPEPLVVKLPRQPGMKESRFAHLLGGEVKLEEPAPTAPREAAAILEARVENERLARLEQQVASLAAEVEELRRQLFDFKRQFE